MRKIYVLLLVSCMSVSVLPMQAVAASRAINMAIPPSDSASASAMIGRLYEIKAMDIASMNPSEKKALRKEVRSIKKDLGSNSKGIYLSVGVIIIIILLLILLV